MVATLELAGQPLTLEEIVEVAEGARTPTLSDGARVAMESSRHVVEKLLRDQKVAYGINTGFRENLPTYISLRVRSTGCKSILSAVTRRA